MTIMYRHTIYVSGVREADGSHWYDTVTRDHDSPLTSSQCAEMDEFANNPEISLVSLTKCVEVEI